MAISIYLEVGARPVFACAVDWPGWCGSGKTEAVAIEAFASYASRYSAVTKGAGVRFPAQALSCEVVGRITGAATPASAGPAVCGLSTGRRCPPRPLA